MANKDVVDYERYTHRETEFVGVTTDDGWKYRFTRVAEDENAPFTPERTFRPDGSAPKRDTETPKRVREYLEKKLDIAYRPVGPQLSDDRWPNGNN